MCTNQVLLSLLSGTLGIFVGIFLDNVFSNWLNKKLWVNELRFYLYQEYFIFSEKFEGEAMNESMQTSKDENLFKIPGSGVRITKETLRQLYTMQRKFTHLFKTAAISFNQQFKVNLRANIDHYLNLKDITADAMATEMKLPRKGEQPSAKGKFMRAIKNATKINRLRW